MISVLGSGPPSGIARGGSKSWPFPVALPGEGPDLARELYLALPSARDADRTTTNGRGGATVLSLMRRGDAQSCRKIGPQTDVPIFPDYGQSGSCTVVGCSNYSAISSLPAFQWDWCRTGPARRRQKVPVQTPLCGPLASRLPRIGRLERPPGYLDRGSDRSPPLTRFRPEFPVTHFHFSCTLPNYRWGE